VIAFVSRSTVAIRFVCLTRGRPPQCGQLPFRSDDRETLLELQASVEHVHVSESVGRYIVELVRGTRESPSTAVGASPRGSLALLKLARGKAALAGRDFATPDDVKAIAVPALAHRLVLKPELWIQRLAAEDIVREVLDRVPTPKAEDVAAPAS